MSELRATTISDKAGTGPATLTGQSAAKAWSIFDGTAGTVSYADSYNMSSITDNGTGDYTNTLTNDFSAASFGMAFTGRRGLTAGHNITGGGPTAGTVRFETINDAGASADAQYAGCQLHGDLA